MQHRPKRSLGQNFLRDAVIADRIVAALDLENDEKVIEIGPGQGALTQRLLDEGARVVAVELDRRFAAELRVRFRADSFELIEIDALDVRFADVVDRPSVKLVANLPYNISTPILQRLSEQREVFSGLVLMFQREVVERITASPGGKERGFLSVVAQNAFEIEYLFDVPPKAFYPVPKVWSAVVRLTPKPHADDEGSLRDLVSKSFIQKRKTLANNLSHRYPDIAAILQDIGFPPKVRAEELTLDEWRRLLDVL